MSASTPTPSPFAPNLSTGALEDLGFSGLQASDIAARTISPAELAATGIPAGAIVDGYVIPYFDLKGDPVPYYRIKMLGTHVRTKYMGIKGASNHIYFPPGLAGLLKRIQPGYILLTEGEKKAACAVKNGFSCVAVSGIDGWRNRRITFPENTELKALKGQKLIQAKIPSGDSHSHVVEDTGLAAVGLVDLADYLVQEDLEIIICFDTDRKGVKTEVQRAAAMLGYEMRYRGLPISKIKQLVLPHAPKTKVGLDDYLMGQGVQAFAKILRATRRKRNAFPRHPNPKTYVASRLQRSRLSRKELQDVALSVLMELEARGRRLRNKATQDVYYFDEKEHVLMQVVLSNPRVPLHETAFGAFLYREFNLSPNDVKVILWLAAQYHGEPGVEESTTHKVLAFPEDMVHCLAYQLSDSHFVILTPNPERPFIICENGTHGVLFEQGQVEPLSHRMLEAELTSAVEDLEEHPDAPVLWRDVIQDFSFAAPSAAAQVGIEPATVGESRLLATLLYYLSPWLLKWHGTQLPVELVVGEPGSGKSSLYELRQSVITGMPRMSNMTNDIRDWYAAITSHGGLHVLDNVHITGSQKDVGQRLSDEICRLVTEPKPHVELRKLYTTAQIVMLPVHVTFAVTSVEQPFFRPDLVQRAAIFELQQIQTGHDAAWVEHRLQDGGGRIGWVAHQLAVIHRFLRLSVHEKKWNSNYRANHRLANYEQALMIMAQALHLPHDWIPDALQRQATFKESEGDWTMGGLREFAEHWKETYPSDWESQEFRAADIADWANTHETQSRNTQLTNPWRLGKYLKAHKSTLGRLTHIAEAGTKGNRTVFLIQGGNHDAT